MSYRVVFSGGIAEGFQREQVMANLAKLTKLDEASVEKKLFSGKKVVIKQSDDREEAERYARTFRRAGAMASLMAVKPTPAGGAPKLMAPEKAEKEPPQKKAQPAAKKTAKASRSRGRTVMGIAAATLFLLAAVAGGGHYYLRYHLLDMKAPNEVAVAERALASNGLVFLGHVNVGKISQLQKTFWETQSSGYLPDPSAEGILSDMAGAGLNLDGMVDHALFAFHAAESGGAWGSAALTGSFPADKLASFVEKNYETWRFKTGGKEFLKFRSQNRDTCEYSPERAVYITPSRIVISSPSAIAALVERIDSGAPAETGISQWTDYRSSRLFSAALFKPARADSMASGMAGMIIAGSRDKFEPVDSLFAGGSVGIAPPRLDVDASVNSANHEWVDATAGQIRAAVADARTRMEAATPSMGALMDSLSVKAAPGGLRVGLSLDSRLAENFRTAIVDILGAFFPMGSVQPSGASGGAPPRDVLDDSPARYASGYSPAKLSSFTAVASPDFGPQWTGGPFGLKVTKASLTDGGLVEITAAAEGAGLVDFGQDAKTAELFITQVTDAAGENLLREETCGMDRNGKPAAFGMFMENFYYKDGKQQRYKRATAEKSVRLRKGAKLEDIVSISGRIDLHLPARVDTRILPAPPDNPKVENGGLVINFKSGGPSEVAYTATGDRSLLIAVRGLNKDKKHLMKSGGFSMDSFIGPGKSFSDSYQGTVKFMEVVTASKRESVNYPFTLGKVFPEPPRDMVAVSAPVRLYSAKKLQRDHGRAKPIGFGGGDGYYGQPQAEFHSGPVNMGVFQFSTNPFFGTTGSFIIRMPVIPALEGNVSAVELAVTGAHDSAGTAVEAQFSGFLSMNKTGGFGGRGPEHMEGQARVSLDYKEEAAPVTLITGQVRLRLTGNARAIRAGSLSLGSSVTRDGYTLKVVEVAPGRIKLRVEGGRSKIVRFRALNSDGKELAGGYGMSLREDGAWIASVSYQGHATGVEMTIADKQDVKNYPFSLKISPAGG